MLYATSKKEMRKMIKERKLFFSKKQIGSFPYVVGIGNENVEVRRFYVIIDDTRYKFDSFLDAFDICFKSYIIFSVKFPPHIKDSLLFINEAFYNVNHAERISTKTRTILKIIK